MHHTVDEQHYSTLVQAQSSIEHQSKSQLDYTLADIDNHFWNEWTFNFRWDISSVFNSKYFIYVSYNEKNEIASSGVPIKLIRPSARSNNLWNMENIWLDGWWIVHIIVVPCFVNRTRMLASCCALYASVELRSICTLDSIMFVLSNYSMFKRALKLKRLNCVTPSRFLSNMYNRRHVQQRVSMTASASEIIFDSSKVWGFAVIFRIGIIYQVQLLVHRKKEELDSLAIQRQKIIVFSLHLIALCLYQYHRFECEYTVANQLLPMLNLPKNSSLVYGFN